MIYQLRMLIAEILLGLAVDIAPKRDDGLVLAFYVGEYLRSGMKCTVRDLTNGDK